MADYQGEKFKIYLKHNGITVVKAAEKLGVTRQTVYQYFETESLTRDVVSKILTTFSATEDQMFDVNHERGVMNSLPGNADFYTTTKKEGNNKFIGVPMYNIPASASLVEMYGDANDVKVVGHLTIPGATKNSFALPVHGHSMYPTLENGSWCVLRPLDDKTDIEWGEIYYIEYGDYRMFKRLLKGDDEDSVVLWSDNQAELIMNKPKYSSKTIKKENIKRLCLLTDILKKPNY